MRQRSIFAAGLVFCTAIPAPLMGQDTIPASLYEGDAVVAAPCAGSTVVSIANLQDPVSDFSRVLEIAGKAEPQSRLIQRPGSSALVRHCPDPAVPDPWTARFGRSDVEEGAIGFELLPVGLQTVNNSGYPGGRNDGALWAGRGLSLEGRGGVEGRWGAISAAVYPSVAYQQNRDFVLAATNLNATDPYRNPWHTGIDLPQRFGPDPFWTVDPGQSYLRADLFNATAGISTENLWWGPGIRNSILMGGAAPGFPHVFAGTSSPANIGIGRLEGQILWGRLTQSDHFAALPGQERRQLTGLVLGYEPRWLPNLHLGLARVYTVHVPDGGLEFSRYFPFLQSFLKEPLVTDENPTGNDPSNQLASIYFRWVLPESGFEVYGEWARDDHSWNLADLIQEPDHSQAFSLGLQKVTAAGPRWVRINAELTHLQERPIVGRQGRPTATYYTHSKVRQGYTHRGQLLGAWIGPGGDSQYLGVDVFSTRGSSGLFVERVRRNDAVFYTRFRAQGFNHDAEVTAGLRHVAFWRGLELDGGLSYSFRYNREFGDDDRNVNATLGASWRPLLRPRS